MKGQAAGKMGHLLAALSDLEGSTGRPDYTVEFTQRDGSLVGVPQGKGRRAESDCTMHAAAAAAAAAR